MTKDKERDDALIAEKERLADILEKKAGNAYYAITSVDLRQAAALLRGDEQPKPDRAEVLFDDLYGKTKDEQIDCFRHFAELRAEWEAERPAVVVPEETGWLCDLQVDGADEFYSVPSEEALKRAARAADIQWTAMSMMLRSGKIEPGFVRLLYAFARHIDGAKGGE